MACTQRNPFSICFYSFDSCILTPDHPKYDRSKLKPIFFKLINNCNMGTMIALWVDFTMVFILVILVYI